MPRQPLSQRGRERLQEAFDTYIDKFCAHISATGATPVLLAAWGYQRCAPRAFLVCSRVFACVLVCLLVFGSVGCSSVSMCACARKWGRLGERPVEQASVEEREVSKRPRAEL